MIEKDILGKLDLIPVYMDMCIYTQRHIHIQAHIYTYNTHTCQKKRENLMTMLESLEEAVRDSFTRCFSDSLCFNAPLVLDLYAVELTEVPIN